MKKPGQPIQVNDMDFLQPERAETRPPEDILKWYSPWASLLMVMGRRLETTMRWPVEPLRSREMESERVGDMARKDDGGDGRDDGEVGDVGESGEPGVTPAGGVGRSVAMGCVLPAMTCSSAALTPLGETGGTVSSAGVAGVEEMRPLPSSDSGSYRSGGSRSFSISDLRLIREEVS